MTPRAKSLFLSHGGGPLPILGDAGHREMVACLKEIATTITRPDAILVVSAHWEEEVPTITAGESPSQIYDYYGFPQESYQIQYPCPGEPTLAREVQRLLAAANIEARLDDERGFDHGLFIPLKLMYPDGEIPCVQLSLVSSLDPATHIDIGRALASLSRQNVLIIGSGFSFHNLKAFFTADTSETRDLNHAFEAWLANTCCSTECSEEERAHMLVRWEEAQGARYAHPREEHLLPLHVCYGVAEAPCTKRYGITVMGKAASMYLW